MKKVVCFVMMLFVLVGVSNAIEFTEDSYFNTSRTESSSTSLSSSTQYGDYTLKQIKDLTLSYNSNGFEASTVAQSYNSMLQNLTDNGYFFFNTCATSKVLFYMGIVSDFGAVSLSSASSGNLLYLFDTGSWYCYNTSSGYFRYDITSEGHMIQIRSVTADENHNVTNLPIKKLEYVSGSGYRWTGEYWYIPPISLTPLGPEEPDFSTLTGEQKSAIINSIVNSEEFINTVPKNYRNQYFIVYEPSIQRFRAYFYPEQYYLKGRKFAEGEVSEVSYESYKIVAFQGSNFLWDMWQSISPFNYYVFSGFLDGDEVFSSQFYGYENSHDLNQHYFSVQDEPIIYSSRDIGFVIYDISSGEYEEDTENGIISSPILDSSGNEITIIIPEEEGSENIGFWDSFIQNLLNGIKKIFIPDYTFIGNQLNLIAQKFVIIGEAKEKFSELVNTIQLAENTPPVITLNFGNADSSIWGDGSAVCFDLSWYAKFKPTVDFIIIVFTYGFFFYRLVRIVPDLLQGASSAPDIAHDIVSTSVKNERIRADRMKHSRGG